MDLNFLYRVVAPISLGLIMFAANCELASINKATNHKLFHQLNDPSLTLDEVTKILDRNRFDKGLLGGSINYLGPYWVDHVYNLAQEKIKNCEREWQHKFSAMQKTFEEGDRGSKRSDWDEGLNDGANYGLAKFVNHYLPKVIKYCGDNADRVIGNAMGDYEKEWDQVIELTDEFSCDQTTTSEEFTKCKDEYLNSKNEHELKSIERSCEKILWQSKFPEEFDSILVAKAEEYAWIFTEARPTCTTFLRVLNGEKGPFLNEQSLKSDSDNSIRPESMPNELYEASSSVEQVDTILEAVEDKDQACLGKLTVKLILTIKLHSTDNCFPDKLSTFEQAKQLSSEAFPHSGLDDFLQHYWSELVRYCGQRIGHIIDGLERTVQAGHLKTIAGLVSNIGANKRITVQEVTTALDKMTETFSSQDQKIQWNMDLESSCKDFGTQYKYLPEIQENRNVQLSREEESKLKALLRAKYACQIYLDDRNMLSAGAILNAHNKMK